MPLMSEIFGNTMTTRTSHQSAISEGILPQFVTTVPLWFVLKEAVLMPLELRNHGLLRPTVWPEKEFQPRSCIRGCKHNLNKIVIAKYKCIDYVTQILPPFEFGSNIRDIEIAWIVCLQNKVCLQSLVRHTFSKFYLVFNKWQYWCNIVYWKLWNIWSFRTLKAIFLIDFCPWPEQNLENCSENECKISTDAFICQITCC